VRLYTDDHPPGDQPPHDPNVVRWIKVETMEMPVDTIGELLAAVRVCLLAGRSNTALRILTSAMDQRGWTLCRLTLQRRDVQTEHSLAAQFGLLRRLLAIGELAAASDLLDAAMSADVTRTPPLDFAIHATPSRELRQTIAAALHREAAAWPP
jgi:hypothetical protein